MLFNIIKNKILNSETTISICKVLIENHSFNEINTIINTCIYNVFNVFHFPISHRTYKTSNIKSYIFFVEGNGHGHVTQMFEIYKQLKSCYKCSGVIVGKEKKDVCNFCIENKIPLISLNEPEYIIDADNKAITIDTLKFLIDYSTKDFMKVANFIGGLTPDFFINLHLPLKIPYHIDLPVFNISSQNRLNFTKYYDTVVSYNEYENYATDCVLLSTYLIHKSYNNILKIAIDSIDTNSNENSLMNIPPLIERNTISSRKLNNVICYFNNFIDEKLIEIFTDKSFSNYKFYIFLNNTETCIDKLKLYYNFEKIGTSEYKYFNIEIHKFSVLFKELRNKSKYVITSCGVETVYENFQAALPMLCIPSNPEQIFNALDHSNKIPGFFWTMKLKLSNLFDLFNFEYNTDYWIKHKQFLLWLDEKEKLKKFIDKKLNFATQSQI